MTCEMYCNLQYKIEEPRYADDNNNYYLEQQQQQNILIINCTLINKIFPLGWVGGFFLTLLGLTPHY